MQRWHIEIHIWDVTQCVAITAANLKTLMSHYFVLLLQKINLELELDTHVRAKLLQQILFQTSYAIVIFLCFTYICLTIPIKWKKIDLAYLFLFRIHSFHGDQWAENRHSLMHLFNAWLQLLPVVWIAKHFFRPIREHAYIVSSHTNIRMFWINEW